MKRILKIVLFLSILISTAIISFTLGRETGVRTESVRQEHLWKQAAEEVRQEVIVQDLVQEDNVEKSNIQKTEVDRKEKILLVNKDNPLPQDYEVELKVLPDRVNKASVEAYEPLVEMLEAGKKEGLNFEICSSYRDRKTQEMLYIEDVIKLMRKGYSYENAYHEVGRETMPPGCSEHSTGLAFDIVALDYQLLDDNQEFTKESLWLRDNCADYGFILRYPKDKEDITGISFESWHFRYVGKEAASYIMENGITLEEYING